MKLRFKHQKFQADAVKATTDVFDGQPRGDHKFLIDAGDDTASFSFDYEGWANNAIRLTEDELLQNLQKVQKQQHILPAQRIEKLNGKPVFTVEMETGTGKTYTYIKAMYELNAKYGWSKFIVIVPSIAIREGVYKSFQITADHFKEEYGKACRFFIYNSARLNELEQYSSDPNINVMIINTQAFNSRGEDARRIDMKLDSFRSRKPIDVIAAVNPIVIIDEPQSVLGTDRNANVTRESVNKFNPLFYINYSATHRENFNMVYRLDAVDAYQQHLVKKINVKGIAVKGSTATNGYLYLQKINTYSSGSPDATLAFEYIGASGNIAKKVKNLGIGDNIYSHSGEIEAYHDGYAISEINALVGTVEFTNGLKLTVGEVVGATNEDDMRRIQIRETILSHLEKERELFKKGIKVLSLFFIDEVAKYKFYDAAGEQKGTYAKIFEEEYAEAIKNLELKINSEMDFDGSNDSPESVHAGYFSIDKKGHVVDSEIKRGESESSDISAYDLIMKHKERLLSFDEPVRFIFSHSALREGWDNPNVFQICTLRQSQGEIKKRQEIGRGLRLCVNNEGERMDAEVLGTHAVHDVNALTVIANESYDDFARALQDEFAEVIKNRPKEINTALFAEKIVLVTDESGKQIEHKITIDEAAEIFITMKQSGLVKDGQLTENYHSLPAEQKIEKIKEQLSDELKPFAENIQTIVANVYDPKRNPLVSNSRKNDKLNLDREKFASKTFKELWAKINAKTYYTVQFDESKLIDACIRSLNKNLFVTQTSVIVTEGYLKETGQDKNPEMQRLKGKEIILQEIANKNVKYDLLKELSTPTRLTRKTIATILSGIEKGIFDKFKQNPEEFIRNAIKLIDEQKASTIIEHITYNLTDEKWKAEDIFVDASISGEYGKNMIDAKKHLYDKLRYDSAVEKQLSEEMDIQDAIEMYVKLPSGFYIHTPMGKYNPDWAISLKEHDVKHIYFVAETKGDLSELSLREVEHTKIECARKHFAKISNGEVKYDVVDSFETLLKKITR